MNEEEKTKYGWHETTQRLIAAFASRGVAEFLRWAGGPIPVGWVVTEPPPMKPKVKRVKDAVQRAFCVSLCPSSVYEIVDTGDVLVELGDVEITFAALSQLGNDIGTDCISIKHTATWNYGDESYGGGECHLVVSWPEAS